MDIWAPRRSGIEGPLDGLELALEAPDLAAQRLPPRRPTEQAVLDEGEKGPRDLLGAPAARRVVPLVEPVEHSQEAEDHEAGRHVPEDTAPDPFDHDGLHA